MESKVNPILDWVIKKIRDEYKNDVALLVGHGFEQMECTPGNNLLSFQSEFDYFVPDTQRAYGLSRSFIVEGICYDLYPRSWESVGSIAELTDCHTSCLAEANILYARSDEDRARFNAMRKKLLDNLKDSKKIYAKASDRLSKAFDIYQTMIFENKAYSARASAAYILDYLAQAVAIANGRYFKRGSLFQLEEMACFSNIPENFLNDYAAVMRTASICGVKRICHKLLMSVLVFLQQIKPESNPAVKPDYRRLADWYQELCHLWRKIYASCGAGDLPRVFQWSCTLQHELNIIREEFILDEMDLMSEYNPENFLPLQKRAKEIETYITDMIIKNSVNAAIYDTTEDFLAKN